MCCTLLAENRGRKKYPKIRHLGTIAQFVGLYLRNEDKYRQSEKKPVKQQSLVHMCP